MNIDDVKGRPTEFLVEVANVHAFAELMKAFAGVVLPSDMDESGYWHQRFGNRRGCIVRTFADPDYVAFAIVMQGYGKIIGRRLFPEDEWKDPRHADQQSTEKPAEGL